MRKYIEKCFVFTALLAAMLLFTGCDGIYDYAEPESPDNSDVVTVRSADSKLMKTAQMDYVEEYVGEDPTLINGFFSASTNGIKGTRVLIENDYFRYDPVANMTFDEINALTEPTNVHVTLYSEDARTNWTNRFSCFVYKIDEDYIYLGTAGHCTYDKSKLKYVNLMFFDRKIIKLKMDDYILGGKFLSSEGDYAMYRVPISVIPTDTLYKLKQVCFDQSHIDNAVAGDKLFTGNIYAKNSTTDYDFESKILTKDADSTVTYYVTNYPGLKSDIYYITNRSAVSGQSGSAIFDFNGYAVGCVSGEFHNSSSTYGIFTKLSKMDKLYQEFLSRND